MRTAKKPAILDDNPENGKESSGVHQSPFFRSTLFQGIGLPILSGLLVFLAYPNFPTPYLSWVALLPLVHSLNVQSRASKRTALRSMGVFYLFGCVAGGLATWWIGAAPKLLGSQLLYTVLIFLPLALMMLAYPRVRNRLGVVWGYLYLASAWVTFDIIQQNFQVSTPFLMLGNTFGTAPWAIQWYELFGTAGGTAWIVAVNASIYEAYRRYRSQGQKKVWLKPALWIVVPLGLSLVMWPDEEQGQSLPVGLLHLRVDQYKEEYSQDPLVLVDKYFDVIERDLNGAPPPRLIMFPETALINGGYIQGFLDQPVGQRILQRVRQLNGPTSVVIGVIAFSPYKGQVPDPLPPHIGKYCEGDRCSYFLTHNTAIAVSTNGMVEVRGKQRYIPFQEHLPYPEVFGMLGEWIEPVGLTAQLSPLEDETLIFTRQVPGYNLAPVVCYESLFPNLMADMSADGANALVVLANENWHSDAWGRWENINLVVPRAIETRRPIIRSANHGISGMISSTGKVVTITDSDESQLFLVDLVKNEKDVTIFASTYGMQYGLWMLIAAALVAGGLVAGKK